MEQTDTMVSYSTPRLIVVSGRSGPHLDPDWLLGRNPLGYGTDSQLGMSP